MNQTNTKPEALQVLERLAKRRIKNKMPKNFKVHYFSGSRHQSKQVLTTVDRCTSGQFSVFSGDPPYSGYQIDRIGFLHESDLTMFLLSYNPEEK